nr:hypothetical protein [uncultured Methanobacterium sp.]
MKTVEDLAEEQLANLDEKKAMQLVTPLRQTWTRAQTETLKVDKITTMETKLVAGDRELQKMALQKRILEGRIMERINKILKENRNLPYQVSEKGVRVDLEKYDLATLRKCCNKKGFDFEQDLFNMIGYIRPIGKGMTAEGAIPVIKPILEATFLKEGI